MTLRPPSPDSDASATVPAALNPPQPDKAASIVAANGQSPTIPPLNSSHLARIPAKLKAVPSLGSLPLPPAPSSGQGQAQKNPARRSGNNPIHAARRPPPSSSTSYFANGKMPKASGNPVLPLNGLFPIAKPSGPPSMRLIDSITPLLLDSKLFYDPDRMRMPDNKKRKSNLTHMGLKIGQGGTLDPLADGVLVMGVNRGTKHLQQFLECTKEYESWGLLGAATTTYDSEGPVLSTHSFDGVTKEDIEKALDQFRGTIMQTPPIFSALKMEGKPLYEYARESKPLPRAIPVRQCEVTIELLDFKPAQVTPGDGGHQWRWPEEHLSDEEKGVFKRLTAIVEAAGTEVKAKGGSNKAWEGNAPSSGAEGEAAADTDAQGPSKNATHAHAESEALADGPHPEVSPTTGLRPAAFKVRMTVSSGTYVRSIVHDIGLALGCGAHVVTLTRTRQGQFTLYGDETELAAKKQEAMSRWYASNPADDASRQAEATAAAAGPATVTAQDAPAGGLQTGEETEEEAAMNASASAVAPEGAAAPSEETATAETDEEAMLNGTAPATGAATLPPKPEAPITATKAKLPGQTVDYTSSTVSIPWSIWEKALAGRQVMLEAEKAEQAAAAVSNEVGEGDNKRKLTPDELRRYFTKEEVMKRRRARPLQEWEEYVLARFEEVPVPIGGAHGTARYR